MIRIIRLSFLLFLVSITLSGCLCGRLREPQFTIWATGDSLKVRPDTPFQLENHHWNAGTSTLSIKGAANEWVALQLILHADREAREVRVGISDLKSEEDRIGRENIHLYREHYIRVTTPTDRNGSTGKGYYPDPLIPFYNPYRKEPEELALPLALLKDENCPLWLDIFIPPGTPPGEYSGLIRIIYGDLPVKELKLNLTVWDFQLPAKKDLKVFFDLYSYRWGLGEGVPFSLNPESWEVLKEYEIMAHCHGFSNGHWGLMPGNINATEGVAWDLYDSTLGTVIDGTLFADGEPPSCWELPFPENWNPGEEVLENYCREVVRHWEKKGWDLDSAFAYVWDERGPKDETVINYGKIIRDASNGKINYFYTHGPHPDLYGIVDWWCPRASQYNPGAVRERQKLGEKGLFYHAGEPSVGLMCLDSLGLAFRTWSWIAWKYGTDGFFDWASNFWGANPYTDPTTFGEDNGNMVLFYPGHKLPDIGIDPIRGPVSSFRMKMVRRGIQDYGYFQLAQQRGINPDLIVDSIIRKGLGETGSYGIDPNAWSRDPEEWYRARDGLGDMIDARRRSE
ncbi:MAG: DUF4091 domain-containing protein [Candidatus Auribacterota bacterium]|nr:DUF4091 domain-containing protein [Candidatus Auribacterota bacterium]